MAWRVAAEANHFRTDCGVRRDVKSFDAASSDIVNCA
ncbi:hypothetical protein SAMN04489711_1336 [Paracidovorax wautersii]|uniref:Uncharacterized protein n=1 Tax=Paracidovorax wautersii TaxID=1177982 RepID=A0A1I2HWK1_9BURK|nr:hypothetical protein SAMN04489711_1336 [Paracidovorax wautersii]